MKKTRGKPGACHGFFIRQRKLPLMRVAASLVFATPTAAQLDPPAWTRPVAPFHIVGNIWYVGTEGLGAYAIKTSGGVILIDATMRENVLSIERNLVSIGVPVRSVRYLLVTHAHFDHAAGDAAFQRDSGAKLVVGAGDAEAIRTGTPPGETTYGVIRFPPARVDRAIRDGEALTLGDTTLTAVATPGHTPRCTTWATEAIERGRRLAVLFPCSLSVAGKRLVDNRSYPGIVADYLASFTKLAAMPADVMLPSHPEFADVMARAKRAAAGDRQAFVAPGLLRRWVGQMQVSFDKEVAKQKTAAR